MLRTTLRVLTAASIIPGPMLAQAQVDPTPAIEAVRQAAFLEGNWAGQGWIQMGQGPREEFKQTETVTKMLDGAVLLIEGIGHSKGDGPEREIHHAMALISFDPVQNTLVFSSYVAGRPRLDLIPEVSPNSFTWGFSPTSGGEIRYSIVVEDGVWHEVGEFSRDGDSWFQFFEMHLNKLAPPGRSEPAQDRAGPVKAQLELGTALYREVCYACHELESGDGETLSPDILASYHDARSLHDYIEIAMPYDEPGSLSIEEYWAVTAYLIADRGLARLDAPLSAEGAEGVRLSVDATE